MNIESFNDIFSDTINVIGNAYSLYNKNNGEIIDQYPTIRFNRIIIEKPQCQGTRWDFLASSELKTFQKYNNEEVLFHTLIFTPYYGIHFENLKEIKFKSKILTLDLKFSEKLMSDLNSRPSTGFQILNLLDHLNKKVNIFGFDWKETPTIYDPLRKKDPHNYKKEKEILNNIIKKNHWTIF